MKYAKVFQQEIVQQKIPPEWVGRAIQYKALKKCINQVVEELQDLGLEKQTLQLLLDYQNEYAKSINESKKKSDIDVTYHEVDDEVFNDISEGSIDSNDYDLGTHDNVEDNEDNKNKNYIQNDNQNDIQNNSKNKNYIQNDNQNDIQNNSKNKITNDNDNDNDNDKNKNKNQNIDANNTEDEKNPVVNITQDDTDKISRKSDVSDTNTVSEPMLRYTFEGTTEEFVPKIILEFDSTSHLPSSAQLSKKTLDSLIALSHPETKAKFISSSPKIGSIDEDKNKPKLSRVTSGSTTVSNNDSNGTQRIEIQLKSDSKFFHMLFSELLSLEDLQTEQIDSIKAQATKISQGIATVTNPKSAKRRKELDTWRQILKLYFEADIFFSLRESEFGQKSAQVAKERMLKYLVQVDPQRLKKTSPTLQNNNGNNNTVATVNSLPSENSLEPLFPETIDIDSLPLKGNGLVKQFKYPESRQLFDEFVDLNDEILKNIQFQYLNEVAMNKILKKFDKATSLSSRELFPTFANTDKLFRVAISRTIYFSLNKQLLSAVPQVDDYLCPICSSIAYKPITLACVHLFCLRCLVKLQRNGETRCPICRQDVVKKADASNLNEPLMRYMQLYFAKEVKIKQNENDDEIMREKWARIEGKKPSDRSDSCIIQ